MRETWFTIKQIIAIVIFVAAFSLMGLMTGRPLMMLIYAAIVLAASAIAFLMIRKRQRHSEIALETSRLPMKIIGCILGLLAIAIPLILTLWTNVITLPGGVSIVAIVIIFALTLVFIALMGLALYLINYKGWETLYRVVGFAVIFIASIIPGIAMSMIDKTASSIGAAYYVALAVLILSYNSMGLLIKQD
ncbi:MAG: hypothetical protein Q8M98_05040 [Candidatus Cloacimonadaceae bacterium]|nr:hypothetical protein [Candidatus Cloacimonadaceae bacterium]MDP3114127.1 hypothetical protein [Candidatus Cloacimonadaceae bacterium]